MKEITCEAMPMGFGPKPSPRQEPEGRSGALSRALKKSTSPSERKNERLLVDREMWVKHHLPGLFEIF